MSGISWHYGHMDDSSNTSKVLSYLDSELSGKRFAYSQPGSPDERYSQLETQIEMLEEVREYVSSLT